MREIPLKPTNPSRERILVVGAFGSGKSNAWVRLAQWLKTTGSTAKLYVITTDYSLDRYLEGWDSSNVVGKEVGDYVEWKSAADSAKKYAKRDDWLVLDRVDDIYPYAQDRVAVIDSGGKSMSEWAVTGTKQEIAGDYGSTWGKINGIYREAMVKNVLGFPGHVYAACQGKEFMKDKDGKIIGNVDDDTKNLFGKFGLKPEGKDLPRYFHSVLLMQQAAQQDWRLNTIRERVAPGVPGREYVKNLKLKDWVGEWLIPVAGWEVEDIWKKAMMG